MSRKPNSDTFDVTRRAMMALAGAAGASSIVSGSNNSTQEKTMSRESSQNPEPSFEYKNVVGEKDWMYDSIQAAHDDVPRYEGGIIFITDTYDSENEQFPITLSNYVRVVGANRGSTTVDAGNAEKPVFKIHEGRSIPHYDWSTTIENVRIVGGDVGVLLSGETHALLENLILVDQTSHGVASVPEYEFASGEFGQAFLNYLRNVDVHGAGSHGIYLPFESLPHAALLDRCAVERCDGNGALITGGAVAIRSGAYEKNGKNGIEIRDGYAVTIRDAYIESNGSEAAQYGQIYLRGQRPMLPDTQFTGEVLGINGAVIEGNYLHRTNATQGRVGIRMENTRNAVIQGNTFRGYVDDETGFVYIDETCRDIDYYRTSNMANQLERGEEENFVLADDGYRTRSNGVVQSTDLSSVRGEFDDDRGIDDGTNTPEGERREYLWYDGAWHSGSHTIEYAGTSTEAAVTFTTDVWDGKHLPVDEATLPDGGFISITDLDGAVVAVSDYLEPGTYTGLVIDFDDRITPDRRHPTHWLVATLHRDSNDNREFDWTIDNPLQVDEPYTDGTSRVNDGTQTTVVTGDSTVIYDDWKDDRLSNRQNSSYPEWNVLNGSAEADEERLKMLGDDDIPVISTKDGLVDFGEWSFDFQYQSEPSGRTMFYLLFEDYENYVRLLIKPDQIEVNYREGGNAEKRIVHGSWNGDTEWHRVSVKRSHDGEYELVCDDTVLAASTQEFLPAHWRYMWDHRAETDIHIDNWAVRL